MPRPARQPLGLHLTRVSRAISRAFDDALAQAGGSLPVWLVMISLKRGQPSSQRELAEAVGIQGATLTHHLNAMESAGLVTRRRDPANRRLHVVELTADGDALFFRLRDAAAAFDEQLRTGLSEQDIVLLETLLARLRDNVTGASRPLRDVRQGAASGVTVDGYLWANVTSESLPTAVQS
jgi:MarR family transcriptional regulator for hemolysin